MGRFKIGVVGLGKIAQDQHVPVISKSDTFAVAAVTSQHGLRLDGVPTFRTYEEMLAAVPDLDAIAICTPPQVRHAIARQALSAGKHVLLEKPPATTLSELVARLCQGARARSLRRLAFTIQSRRHRGAGRSRR